MDEAKDYKAYLKALKAATDSVKKDKYKKYKKNIGAGIKVLPDVAKFSGGGMCRGMGAAVKGGNFKGVM